MTGPRPTKDIEPTGLCLACGKVQPLTYVQMLCAIAWYCGVCHRFIEIDFSDCDDEPDTRTVAEGK